MLYPNDDGGGSNWDRFFPAKITAKTGTSPILYSWTEQALGSSGYEDADPANSGDSTDSPAMELNNADVDVDTFVYMRVRGESEADVQYEFAAPEGSLSDPTIGTVTTVDGTPSYNDIHTLKFDEADGFVITEPATGIARIDLTGATVEELDGSPSYTDIRTFQFDSADGFVVTNPSSRTARVDIAPASLTQAGVVIPGTQEFSGTKKFNTDIHASNIQFHYADLSGVIAGTYGNIGFSHSGAGADPVALGLYVVADYFVSDRSLTLQLTASESDGTNARLDLATVHGGLSHTKAIDIYLSSGSTLVQTGTGTVSGLSFLSGFYISGTLSVGSGDIAAGAVGTTQLADNAVTDAKLRDSGPLSVIGRSANSTGDPADISAVAASGAVLRESGSTLGFGTIATAGIADDAVTDAKLRESAGLSVIGRSANSTGNPADITAANDHEVLRRSGTSLGFGTVATAGIANDAVTYAKIQDVSATSRVLGRKTSGAGDTEECTLSEVLDFIGSAAQGDVLYRGAATWARLGAGTAYQMLRTGGAGANPSWANVDGGTW